MTGGGTSSRADGDREAPARIKRPVFYGAAVGVVLIVLWTMVSPTAATHVIGSLVDWTSEWFGWFYILLASAVLVFVVSLALSRYGHIKLGPEGSTPQYGTLTWASMLFAAGIGIDLMFYAVAGPVTQYLTPPVGDGETVEAAREATVWTIFHYGLSGWGMYALMGMALAFFSYRWNLPLAVRSALYPVFGKRMEGTLGNGVDLAAVLGTVFGVATSLGIGVVQLNFGLKVLFGIPEGRSAQVGLIVLAAGVATVSAVSGVDKGIKRLSQVNVLLAIGLAAFLLVAGNTPFLLNGLVLGIGDFVSSFPERTMQTFAFDQPTEWMNSWTLFFWAWWITWAAFVGLFLARISRGRTIREFVVGTMLIPFSYIVMWVSIFGNSAIERIRDGDAAFGELVASAPQQGFYALLMDYPAFPLIGGLATIVGLLFYITSADSGALVVGNLTSSLRTPHDDASKPVRAFWGVVTGLLTAAMLIMGGIGALQNATIIMALPSSVVLVLVMVGLFKALRVETLRTANVRGVPRGWAPVRTPAASAVDDGTGDWRKRLDRSMAFPTVNSVIGYLDEMGVPALDAVAAELRERGVETHVRRTTDEPGGGCVELKADLDRSHPFHYAYRLRWRDVPKYAWDNAEERTYVLLEVHLGDVGQGYDVMGCAYSQLIDDVLDQYERHLEFLRLHEQCG